MNIHLLTSLAGGRLMAIFEGEQQVVQLLNVVPICVQVLIGNTSEIPAMSQECRLDPEVIANLKNITRSLRPIWRDLHFDMQLPDRNVLIPPWITDPNIFKFNPELEQNQMN